MKSEEEVRRAIDQYADMVTRLCLLRLKSRADSEDVFQEVFLKYAMFRGEFTSAEHEKAWLIRVTLNACRDSLRSAFRTKTVPLELLGEQAAPEQRAVLSEMLALPQKYRDVLYLHDYEGYTAAETGEILGKKENTVYSLLSRGRELLRRAMTGGDA